MSAAACASLDSELAAARQSWRGASFDEFVSAWGHPARSDKSGSQEKHTWVSDERIERAGSGYGGAGGALFGAGGGGRCERTIIFRSQRAVDESWSGDAEFCKRFGRRR